MLRVRRPARPCEPQGSVTCGIGIGSTPDPTISYISPTDPITQTGTKRELAGLEFEFLYAPDTEAPEEMHIWIPQLKALTCAENANHSLHNIQTLRGARTRDARNFARYLDETLERWGDEAEVHYGPHTWPVWGNANVVAFIESQRDTYKYIHDQALRLANKGYTPLEAAEVATASAKIVESTARRRRPPEHPGLLDHRLDRVVDPVRPGRLRDPPAPVHQGGRVEPRVIQRRADRHLPPHVEPDRLSGLPVRIIMQRLQCHHRGHLRRRDRRAAEARRGEQIRVIRIREHPGPVRGQEREHAARRDQVPGQRRRVQ